MKKMNALDWIAWLLLVIGGLNWGLIGLVGFDVVAAIFGTMSLLARLVYVLVGLSALYLLIKAPMKPKAGMPMQQGQGM